MQAVVVAGAVLQQQRRRPGLAGGVAALQERVVAVADSGCRCPWLRSSDWRRREAADRAPAATPRSGRAADRQSICTRRARSRGAPSRPGCGNERRPDRAPPARGTRPARAIPSGRRSPARRDRSPPASSRSHRRARRCRRRCGMERCSAAVDFMAASFANQAIPRHPISGRTRVILARSAKRLIPVMPGCAS